MCLLYPKYIFMLTACFFYVSKRYQTESIAFLGPSNPQRYRAQSKTTRKAKEMCVHWVTQRQTDPFLEAVHLGDGGCGEEADLELRNEATRRRERLPARCQPWKGQGGTSQAAPQRRCPAEALRWQREVRKSRSRWEGVRPRSCPFSPCGRRGETPQPSGERHDRKLL